MISLAHAAHVRAQLVTQRILQAPQSRHELLRVVKNLDRLSDILCGVIDLTELVRNAHPDPIWVEAANDAYETLCESMNFLNTHVGLYEVGTLLSKAAFLDRSPLHTGPEGSPVGSHHRANTRTRSLPDSPGLLARL